jgi:hypothetical protein
VFTSKSLRVFHYLAAAVVRKTGGVENSVIVLDAAYVTIQKEEVVLVSVVLVLNTVVDFTDQVEVARLLLVSLSGVSLSVLAFSIVFTLLMSQSLNIFKSLSIFEVSVPLAELIATLMLQVHIKHGVIVSSIQTFATKLRDSSSFDSQYIGDLLFTTSLTHVTPQSQRNGTVGVVNQRHILPNFLLATSKLNSLLI